MSALTDDRLREIASTPLSLAPSVCNYVDAWYAATELLAARQRLAVLERVLEEVAEATEEFRKWQHCEAGQIEGQEAEFERDHNRMLDAIRELGDKARAALDAAKERTNG